MAPNFLTHAFPLVLLICSITLATTSKTAQAEDSYQALNQQVVRLSKQKKYADAIPIARRAFKLAKEKLEPTNPTLRTLLANLAELYKRQKKYAEAEAVFRRALALADDALPPNHKDLSPLLTQIGLLSKRLKHLDTAVRTYERALVVHEANLDKNDPKIAVTLFHLGDIYRLLRRHADAEQSLRRALKIFTSNNRNGTQTKIAAVKNSLGLIYFHQSRFDEAQREFEGALKLREKHLGADHDKVATSLSNLATLQKELGNLEKAEPLILRAIKIRQRARGKDHPSIANLLNTHAEILKADGKLAEAEPVIARAIRIREKALGRNHEATARLLANQADLFTHQGRYAEAEPLLKHAVATTEKKYGANHRNVASFLNNLASLYRRQDRLAEAEALYQRTLRIREETLGPNHLSVGESLSNLAGTYRARGKYGAAVKPYLRAYKIIKNRLGPSHFKLSTLRNNIGRLFLELGQLENAERAFKQALNVLEKTETKTSLQLGTTLNNLAETYKAQKRFKDALPLQVRTLKIYKSALGNSHMRIAELYNNIAGTHLGLKQYSDAESHYQKSLAIFDQALPSDHPAIATTLRNLAITYGRAGDGAKERQTRKKLTAFPKPGTRHLPVYYATTRAWDKVKNDFGGEAVKTLTIGKSIIQVPAKEIAKRAKRISDGLASPDKSRKALSSAEAFKRVRLSRLQFPTFASDIQQSQRHTSLFKNQALVFIHGYNVEFDEALQRLSQIAFDLQFDGTLIAFSWPSRGATLNYLSDRTRADSAAKPFVNLLDKLSKERPDTTIHVLAHSMGNRVLSRAMKLIAQRGPNAKRPNLGEIILAHADIAPEWCSKVGKVRQHVRGITNYVNSDDWALWVSKGIRAGKERCGRRARHYKGIETIDTTGMGGKANVGSLIFANKDHHGVFANDPILFGEITRLISSGQRPPSQRTPEFIRKSDENGKPYWAYKPTRKEAPIAQSRAR